MNNIKKFFFVSALTISSCLYSQDNVVIKDNFKVEVPEFEFRGNWELVNDKRNSLVISGSQITNNSSVRSNNLQLKVYFLETNKEYDLNSLPNKLNDDIIIGYLDGNRASFNNLRISFNKNQISDFLAPGTYKAVVVLNDLQTKKVKNYKVLDETFVLGGDVLALVDSPNSIEGIAKSENLDTYGNNELSYVTPNSAQVIENYENLPPEYRTDYTQLNFSHSTGNVVLEGDWALDIDFEKLSILINGNNSIENRTQNKTGDLKLIVYLSENLINNDDLTVKGYELLRADIESLNSLTQRKNVGVEANITKIIPTGEYYPLLLLQEQLPDGGFVIKSAIKYNEKFKF